MNIIFFHWANNNGPSIVRSFRPFIDKLKETDTITEYRVPCKGGNPINIIKNILFVYRHRNKKGINHITGDIHYCILGLLGVKSVVTIHDDYAMVTASSLLKKIYRYFFWIFLPVKLSNVTVCVTKETKRKIDLLVHNKKTIVITHHSIDSSYHNFPKKFNEKNPIILQIGTNHQKNLETTIKALVNIKCKLKVIKRMTKQQHQLATDLHIDYSNAFDLTDEEILEEYIKSDIVVFPSLYEGLGLPIVEGQAIGRPVITSNISPMNWVAGNGAVLLNNPTNIEEYREAILHLIHDEGYRESIINRGIKNVERFSLMTSINAYKMLYKSIK